MGDKDYNLFKCKMFIENNFKDYSEEEKKVMTQAIYVFSEHAIENIIPNIVKMQVDMLNKEIYNSAIREIYVRCLN